MWKHQQGGSINFTVPRKMKKNTNDKYRKKQCEDAVVKWSPY